MKHIKSKPKELLLLKLIIYKELLKLFLENLFVNDVYLQLKLSYDIPIIKYNVNV